MEFYQSEEQHSNFVSCFSPNLRLQFGSYARGYRHAAGILAQHLIAKNRFPDYEGYPLVFLYRHAFELALKNVIYQAALLAAFRRTDDIDGKLRNDHNLERLSRVATKSLLAIFSDDDDLNKVCDRVSVTAREFTSIDAD